MPGDREIDEETQQRDRGDVTPFFISIFCLVPNEDYDVFHFTCARGCGGTQYSAMAQSRVAQLKAMKRPAAAQDGLPLVDSQRTVQPPRFPAFCFLHGSRAPGSSPAGLELTLTH